MADVYSFTTNVKDDYFQRVIEEAPADRDFIIIKEVPTVGPVDARLTNIAVLVSENLINEVGEAYPDHMFLKDTLGDCILQGMVANVHSGYYSFAQINVPKDRIGQVEVQAKNDINRLKNLATDRIVKVTVETL